MDDKARQYGEAKYLERISEVPTLQFHQFVEPVAWIKDIYLGKNKSLKRIAEFDVSTHSREQCVEWLTAFLRSHGISGDYLFSFANLPLALVTLSGNYEWIKSLWFPQREPATVHFVFITCDHSNWLSVRVTEKCMSNNCYEAWSAQKPSTFED